MMGNQKCDATANDDAGDWDMIPVCLPCLAGDLDKLCNDNSLVDIKK